MDKEPKLIIGKSAASVLRKAFSCGIRKCVLVQLFLLLCALGVFAEEIGANVISTMDNTMTIIPLPGRDLSSFGPPPPIIQCNDNPPLPSNDAFANARQLTGMSVGVCGNNTQATAEPGEPNHGGVPAKNSAWYRWTASATGIAQIGVVDTFRNTYGSSLFSSLVAVYTGSALNSLVLLADNSSLYSSSGEGGISVIGSGSVRFSALAGQTYWIAVDRRAIQGGFGIYELTSPGQFVLTIQLASLQLVDVSTNLVTGQPMEVEYASYGDGPELFQLSLIVAGNSVETLTNAPWRFTCSPTNSGTVPVWVQGIATNGEYVISWPTNLTFRPANDDFTNAIQIGTVSGGSFSGNSGTATMEPGEPTPIDSLAGGTIWWKWVAPYSVETKVTLATGSSLVGYQGDALDSLQEIFRLNGSRLPPWVISFPPQSLPSASFQAVAGTTYYFSAQGGNNIWIFPGQAQSTRPISWTLDQQTLRLQPSGSQIGWVNQPIQLNAISIETNISSDHVDFILGAQATVFPMSSQYYLHTIGSLGTATNPPYNVSWSPTQIGTFYVWARSTNSQGIVHESAPTTFQVLAENDLFSHATVIAPETQSANFNFYTQTASAEPSEPLRYGKAAQYTLWWKWTPSYSGTVRIKAIRDYSYTGVPIGLPVEVFAGNDLQHLRRLASNRNKVGIAGLSGIVRLKFQAGKTYYVRTDEYSPGPMPVQPNDGSPATLSIEPVSQPLPGELNFSLIVGYRNQNGLSVPIAFARVFGTDGKTPLVGYSFGGGYGGGSGSGPNYVAQLYAARTRPELAPVGSVRPFASSWSSARPFPWAGLFSPTPIVLPGIMAGERVFAQIRVWDSNYGDSFENARANGSPTGTSEIVNVVAGSEETGGTLLLGIKSFSLHKGTSGN